MLYGIWSSVKWILVKYIIHIQKQSDKTSLLEDKKHFYQIKICQHIMIDKPKTFPHHYHNSQTKIVIFFFTRSKPATNATRARIYIKHIENWCWNFWTTYLVLFRFRGGRDHLLWLKLAHKIQSLSHFFWMHV